MGVQHTHLTITDVMNMLLLLLDCYPSCQDPSERRHK